MKSIFLLIAISSFANQLQSKELIKYSCEQRDYLDSKEVKVSPKISGTVKIDLQGVEKNKKSHINISNNIYTLTLTDNDPELQRPESVLRLSCDSFLNCNGYKIKYKRTGESKLTNFIIGGGNSLIQAKLGSRLVLSFAGLHEGFSFKYFKYDDNDANFVGTEIICKR